MLKKVDNERMQYGIRRLVDQTKHVNPTSLYLMYELLVNKQKSKLISTPVLIHSQR